MPWKAPQHEQRDEQPRRRRGQPDERPGARSSRPGTRRPSACYPPAGSSQAPTAIAAIEPTGVASSTSPRLPSESSDVRLDVRNVRRPRGEEQPVDEEDRPTSAGPRSARRRLRAGRRSAYQRRYGRSRPDMPTTKDADRPSIASSCSTGTRTGQARLYRGATAARSWRRSGSRSTARTSSSAPVADDRQGTRRCGAIPGSSSASTSKRRRTPSSRFRASPSSSTTSPSRAGSPRSSAAATWAPTAPRSSASATASPGELTVRIKADQGHLPTFNVAGAARR